MTEAVSFHQTIIGVVEKAKSINNCYNKTTCFCTKQNEEKTMLLNSGLRFWEGNNAKEIYKKKL